MIRINKNSYVNARHVTGVARSAETLYLTKAGAVDEEERIYLKNAESAEAALQVLLRCLQGEDVSVDVEFNGSAGADQWIGRRHPLVPILPGQKME